MLEKLTALLAAFNDGANKGFWRFQWRDRLGRWAEMGRGVLGKLRLKDGSIVSVRGVFVGGTENPGFGRVLVEGQSDKGIPDGIYQFASGNGETFEGLIPEEDLIRQGLLPEGGAAKKDIFGNSVGERLDKDIQDLETIRRDDITDEDRKLATETPDERQKALIEEERAKSPVAQLPAGSESDPDALAKALEDAGIVPTVPLKPLTEKLPTVEDLEKAESASPISKLFAKIKSLFGKKGDGKFAEVSRVSSALGDDLKVSYENVSVDITYSTGVGGSGEFSVKSNTRSGSFEITNDKSSMFVKPKDDGSWAVSTSESGEEQTFPSFEEAAAAVNKTLQDDLGLPKDFKFEKSWWGGFDKLTAFNNNPRTKNKRSSLDLELSPEFKDHIGVARNYNIEEAEAKNDFLLEKAIRDAMDGKPVDVDEIIKMSAPTPVGRGGDFRFEEDDEEEAPKPPKTPKGKKPEEPETPETEKTPVKQEGITVEELDALAKPEDYEKFFGFLPSTEQTRIINAIAIAKKNTAVRAGAGAGKTTTYVGLSKVLMEVDPNARVALLQLNRTNADEAAKVVPSNTISNTVDAYFGRPHIVDMARAKTGTLRGSGNDPHVTRYMSKERWHISGAKDLGNHFLMDEMNIGGENYDIGKVAALVSKAVERFCRSTDDKIGPQHFNVKTKAKKATKTEKAVDSEDVEIPDDQMKKLLGYANAYWEDLNHVPVWDERVSYKKKDGTPAKKFVKGVTAISPTHAFKMWALSKPDLSKLTAGDGKPITHMFLDEAQDTNAVFEKVLNDNLDAGTAPLIAMVGDRAQSIYKFRGSRDALTNFAQKRAGANLTLTTTRRFGEDILPVANGFLNLLGEDYRLKSEIAGGEILSSDSLEDIPDFKGNTAIQTRTNAEVFNQIEKLDAQGYTVGVTEKMYEDLTQATSHLDWLSQDYTSRTAKPEGFSSDFAGMNSLKDLIQAAEIDPSSRAGFWWRLIQENPEEKIKRLKDLAGKVTVQRDQIDINTVTNLDASDRNTGEFNGIKWAIDGDSIIISGDVFSKIPGREDKNFRQAVVGQKAKGSTPALDPEVKLPDGTTPEWRTRKVGNDWITSLAVSDPKERSEYLNKLASLFMANTKEAVVPDVMISTAHRYKGLERDNILIAPDFPIPETNEKGDLVIPSSEELNLAYTAVTRPRKRIFYGPLDYALDYTGENGMRKANQDLEREPDYGMDVVKREAEAQAAITAKRETPVKSALKSGQGQSFAGGFKFNEDEDAPSNLEQILKDNPWITPTVPVKRSTTPDSPGKDVVDGWSVGQNGTFSRRIDGTTWNIRENADGTITVRPRTNEGKVGSFKFNDWESLKNNFPGLQEKSAKANRDTLKEKVAPFDKDGEIAKAIDNGADSNAITDMIKNSDEFSDAVENGDVSFVSIFAAMDNVGPTNLDAPNPKTAKPKTPETKKATKPTAAASSDLYTQFNNPNDKREEIDIFGDPKLLDQLLRSKGKGTVEDNVRKLVNEAGGRVNPDGSVTIFKKTMAETAGPDEGKDVELEIRWTGNKASSGTISYILTDPEDGFTEEYYDYSPTHSFAKIVSGVNRRLNTYFLADPETLPENLNPATYGGVRGAVNRLRTGLRQTTARKGIGGLTGFLQDRKSSDTNIKLRTPIEHAAIALNGRDSRLNNSNKNWHTVQRKGITSLFDAVDGGERAGAVGALRQYLNDIPNTPAAQKAARDYVETAVKNKFPSMSQNKVNAILDDIFDGVNSSDPIPTSAAQVPHLSKNGVQIVPGQKVRWKNNIDGEVVGQVSDIVSVDNPDGGRYAYRDFVEVKFKNSDGVVRLNAKNMSVVDDSTPVTGYSGWVRNNDLKIRRAEQAGFTYNPDTGEFMDGDSVVDINTLANSQYPLNVEPGNTKAAKDVKAGDVIYNDNGEIYGKVEKIKAGTQNGVKGRKITFDPLDGQEDLFFEDDEQVTIPKPKEAATSKPKTTSNADIAKAAKDAGLAPSADGTSTKKKIATHPSKVDPDTNTDIKGTKKKAIKPTDEANAVLDKQLELGKQAWDQIEPRIIEELNAKGYNIKPGTKYEYIDKAVEVAADKAFESSKKSKKSLDEFMEETKSGIRGKKEIGALTAQMEKDGLMSPDGIKFKDLAARLKAAGLEDYSYEVRGLGSDFESDLMTGLAAYKVLNTPALKSQAEKMWKDHAKKLSDYHKARDNRSKFTARLKAATKDATKKTLEDLGVSFDNVSLDEFDGRIVSVQDEQPLDSLSTFKSARALRAAFDHMPSNKIRQLSKYLKDNNVKLHVISGVPRGHFQPRPNGDLEITLSTAKGTQANDSTALHELQHFLDHVDPNSNIMAHAWLHRRAMSPDGQTLRPTMTWGKGETGFAITDLESPYTSRRYERGQVLLDPNFRASEVNSTIMEDLFLDAGSVSRPTGQWAIVKKMVPRVSRKTGKIVTDKDGKPVMVEKYEQVKNPFHDPKTDKWYTDESMSEELDVRDFFGRRVDAGLDRNVKHYGLGMLLMMNDWSATEGLETNLGNGKKG
jgi:hypothetical protein